jgi:hypothetical protein
MSARRRQGPTWFECQRSVFCKRFVPAALQELAKKDQELAKKFQKLL